MIKVVRNLLLMSLLGICFAEARPGKEGKANKVSRQDFRMNQGLKNGQLTKREYVKLQKKDHRIDLYRKKALSDGELSKREKMHLRKMNKNLNKNIWKEKHDGQGFAKGPANRPQKGSKEFFQARKRMKEKHNQSPDEAAAEVESSWDVAQGQE